MSEHDNRAIVVGVDGTPGSRAALAFALREGLVRQCTVEVVTTWLMGPTMGDIATATSLEEEQERAEQCQESAVAEVLAGFAERPVMSRLILQSYGGRALVDAAHDAALLVVGSGRKSVLARALLGSVSEYCVRHARVPVVVVPDPAQLEAESRTEEIVDVGARG